MVDNSLWQKGKRLYDVTTDSRIEIQRFEGNFVRFIALDDGGEFYEQGQTFLKQRYKIVEELGRRHLYTENVDPERYGPG